LIAFTRWDAASLVDVCLDGWLGFGAQPYELVAASHSPVTSGPPHLAMDRAPFLLLGVLRGGVLTDAQIAQLFLQCAKAFETLRRELA
jgi:hypothetical protein